MYPSFYSGPATSSFPSVTSQSFDGLGQPHPVNAPPGLIPPTIGTYDKVGRPLGYNGRPIKQLPYDPWATECTGIYDKNGRPIDPFIGKPVKAVLAPYSDPNPYGGSPTGAYDKKGRPIMAPYSASGAQAGPQFYGSDMSSYGPPPYFPPLY